MCLWLMISQTIEHDISFLLSWRFCDPVHRWLVVNDLFRAPVRISLCFARVTWKGWTVVVQTTVDTFMVIYFLLLLTKAFTPTEWPFIRLLLPRSSSKWTSFCFGKSVPSLSSDTGLVISFSSWPVVGGRANVTPHLEPCSTDLSSILITTVIHFVLT